MYIFMQKVQKKITVFILGALLFSSSPARAWEWHHIAIASAAILALTGLFYWSKAKASPEIKKDKAPDVLSVYKTTARLYSSTNGLGREGIQNSLSPIPTTPPTPVDQTTLTKMDRIKGCLYGAIAGDMLGGPVEFNSVAAIQDMYGDDGLTGLRKLKGHDIKHDKNGRPYVRYTDDTAMARLVFRELTFESSFKTTMHSLAIRFINDMKQLDGWAAVYRAPGVACKQGVQRLGKSKSYGLRWWDTDNKDAGGCGSVMRAYPFGLFFAYDYKKGVEWAVEHSRLTHSHPIALAACGAFAAGIAYAMQGKSVDEIAKIMAETADAYDNKTAKMLTNVMQKAHEANKVVDKDVQSKMDSAIFVQHQGWAAHDALAAGLYCFMRHANDPYRGIILGVNTPGDSDSIASIGGALLGTYNGYKRIPQAWIEHVEDKEGFENLFDNAKSCLIMREDVQKGL